MISLYVVRDRGGRVKNIYCRNVPAELSDGDVQHTFEQLAEQGDTVATHACAALGAHWIALNTDSRTERCYMDDA